ncbi:MAG: bifunctional glutamate N-acetyltransferase/amino-acid acetyltransferase ArgJ [Longicatena sp.]|nr:bifunctional glutamate N-acetyltransferase/amino-acid acetyltransferase ArgJ [Longicatena sp.]
MSQAMSNAVCFPKGFKANGIHCGVRKNRTKKDLALIYSETPCSAAAVYTLNKVKGAPINVTKQNLEDGIAQAMLCNSGNANTCNANGIEIAQGMCDLCADSLKINASDIIIASTGVIGEVLSLEPFETHMDQLVAGLSAQNGSEACEAIMTTDTVKKEFVTSFMINDIECRLGIMAKGSGMIHPNMATMLAFVTTDVNISPAMLKQALSEVVQDTFNMVSVDGDTSTNDMLSIMANGAAQNEAITCANEAYQLFKKALYDVCVAASRAMAKDGEGATKLLTAVVTQAPDVKTAKIAAKSVITSSLFKAAMFGKDANWGRILCALGYCEADFDITKVDVTFRSGAGSVAVCKNGAGCGFNENDALTILAEDEIIIAIDLNQGNAQATAWGCDLTYDYVKINGDYRT